MPSIGWFGEDLWETAKDVVSDAGDVVVDVFGEVPGSPELVDAIKDIVRGPLRDFARSPVGMTVLRAMSTTIYGPWAHVLGPQLASIVFALPGLARGQDFWSAWFDEVKWRTEKTAEVLGADAAMAVVPGIDVAVKKLEALVPEQALSMALPDLAATLGVDEWTAAMAVSAFFENMPMPPREEWDPFTWKRRISSMMLGARTAADVEKVLRFGVIPDGTQVRSDPATTLRRLRYIQTIYRPPDAPPVRVAAPSPYVVAAAAPEEGKFGSVALVVAVGAALGAIVWLFVGEKR